MPNDPTNTTPNSDFNQNYTPNTPQSYKNREANHIGANTPASKKVVYWAETATKGQSKDTFLGNTSLNASVYRDVATERSQDGSSGFPSLTERPYVPGSELASFDNTQDNNPIKEIETEVGDINAYAYNKSAEEKETHVDPTTEESLLNKKKKEKEPEYNLLSLNTSYSMMSIDWGFRIPKINLTKSQVEKLKKTYSNPYCRITEDYAGTAAYGYGEDNNLNGTFSNTAVSIEILQNLTGIRISGSRQDFNSVEPRGSQRPMYFYQKNTGRTLGFTATFHQQEYPLEPLYSIAEKAQNLLRPYRHGDYGLIPKTVRVEIPGRVFRCYCTNAEATFEGEDYRGWSDLGLNETNIGSAGNGVAYTGIRARVENYTTRVFNSSADYIQDNGATQDYRYGLSSMTISFEFNILEEIRLTTYNSQQEVNAQTDQWTEEERKKKLEYELEKAQQLIENIKAQGIQVDYTAEQLVTVDKEGNYVSTLITEEGEILPVSDPNSITVEKYNDYHQIKNSNPAPSPTVQNMVVKVKEASMRPADTSDMLAEVTAQEVKNNPGKDPNEVKKEVEEKYKDNPTALYDAYKSTIQGTSDANTDGEAQAQAKFLSYNETLNISQKDGKVLDIRSGTDMPNLLKDLFDNPLKTHADLSKFGSRLLQSVEPKIKAVVKFATIKRGGSIVESYPVEEKSSEDYEVWKLPFWKDSESLNKMGYFGDVPDFENTYLDFGYMLDQGTINEKQYTSLEKNCKNKDIGFTGKLEIKIVCDSGNIGLFNFTSSSGKVDTKLTEYILSIFQKYQSIFCSAITDRVDNLCNSAIESAISLLLPYLRGTIIEEYIKTRKTKCFSNNSSVRDAIKLDSIDFQVFENLPSPYDKYKVYDNFSYNYVYYTIIDD